MPQRLADVQKLMGCLAFVGRLERSPYAVLFDESEWDRLADTIATDACRLMGLPRDLPLSVCIEAGIKALPNLLKFATVMQVLACPPFGPTCCHRSPAIRSACVTRASPRWISCLHVMRVNHAGHIVWHMIRITMAIHILLSRKLASDRVWGRVDLCASFPSLTIFSWFASGLVYFSMITSSFSPPISSSKCRLQILFFSSSTSPPFVNVVCLTQSALFVSLREFGVICALPGIAQGLSA
jgi:hypothetical protein